MRTALFNTQSVDKTFLNFLAAAGGRFVLEEKGQISQVLLPIAKLYSWLETLDILSDKNQRTIIEKSLKDEKKGKTLPIESIL